MIYGHKIYLNEIKKGRVKNIFCTVCTKVLWNYFLVLILPLALAPIKSLTRWRCCFNSCFKKSCLTSKSYLSSSRNESLKIFGEQQIYENRKRTICEVRWPFLGVFHRTSDQHWVVFYDQPKSSSSYPCLVLSKNYKCISRPESPVKSRKIGSDVLPCPFCCFVFELHHRNS